MLVPFSVFAADNVILLVAVVYSSNFRDVMGQHSLNHPL